MAFMPSAFDVSNFVESFRQASQVPQLADVPFVAPEKVPELNDAYNDVTVIVTGASGFLGSHLVERLLQLPIKEIHVMGRNSSNFSSLPWKDNPKVIIHRFEKLDQMPNLDNLPETCEYAFHCAGTVTDWASDDEFFDGNVNSCRRLFQTLVRYKTNESLRRVIHVSTTDVYGYPKVPTDESNFPRDERIGYNSSKLYGEMVWFKAVQLGWPVTVVRPASIYGPRSPDFVLGFAKQLQKHRFYYIGGGKTDAGLIYVTDCVEMLIQASIRKHAEGQIYNAWGLENVSWKTYVDAMAEELGLKRPGHTILFYAAFWIAYFCEIVYKLFNWYGPGSHPFLTLTIVFILGRRQDFPAKRAVRELDFKPKVDFVKGMKLSCEWLRKEHGFGGMSSDGWVSRYRNRIPTIHVDEASDVDETEKKDQ